MLVKFIFEDLYYINVRLSEWQSYTTRHRFRKQSIYCDFDRRCFNEMELGDNIEYQE